LELLSSGVVHSYEGVIIVLVGSPGIGILLEFLGFLNLFGNTFVPLSRYLRNLPMLGQLLAFVLPKEVDG
jgi:hypothetical protein